jgi:hypothetical protein
MATNADRPPGRDRAEALMQFYARKEGRYDAELDASGDISFGEFGFRHDPDKDALTGRVFVAKAWRDGAPEAQIDAYMKVGRGLNDPAIGGLFEQGGGYFHLDPDKRIYFLKKDFPLATTTREAVDEGMEELRDLAATWTTRWFGRVADITHGRALPPLRPVKRGDPDEQT